MTRLTDSIVVDAPPVDVFEFFRSMDEDRYLAWHPDHVAFAYVEGDRVKEGAVAVYEEVVGEERVRSPVRYTEVRPPEYVEFRDTRRRWRLLNPRNAFAFEPVDGRTGFVATVDLRIGPLERISASVRRDLDALRQHMAEEGENLKRLVEDDRRTGGGEETGGVGDGKVDAGGRES